jgi:hypothetical protein
VDLHRAGRGGYKPAEAKEFKRGGERLVRASFIRDPDGHKIEMLERHGHDQQRSAPRRTRRGGALPLKNRRHT